MTVDATIMGGFLFGLGFIGAGISCVIFLVITSALANAISDAIGPKKPDDK